MYDIDDNNDFEVAVLSRERVWVSLWLGVDCNTSGSHRQQTCLRGIDAIDREAFAIFTQQRRSLSAAASYGCVAWHAYPP